MRKISYKEHKEHPAMAPKLTKRELERERAEQQQQQGGMSQQQGQGMDPYAMAHMGGGAHPHDMVMGGDALGGQPMGAASMLPGGVGSPPPHHPMGMYQYPDHSGDDLGSYVHDPDLGYYDSRRSTSPAVGDLKRRADEAFTEPIPTLPTNASDDWESASKSGKKKKPQGRSAPTPTSAGSMGQGNDKSSKGLRHFSMKVCKKVEEKGRTNYNEVADELVREVLNPKIDPHTGVQEQAFDEKNIRRRVYDALNVLMAMDIISKEKKEIRWKGLPSNAQHDIEMMQREKRALEDSVAKKREHLQDLIMQRVAFKRLVKRNVEREASTSADGSAAAPPASEEPRVPLPFILINTNHQTIIQCEMTEDRSDVFFNFSAPFHISDDTEVLKRLELHKATAAEMASLVPPELQRYVPTDAYLDAPPLPSLPPLLANGSHARGVMVGGTPQQPHHPSYMMMPMGYDASAYATSAAMAPPGTQRPLQS